MQALDAATLAMMRRMVPGYMLTDISIQDASTVTNRYAKGTTTYSTVATAKGQFSAVNGSESRLLNSLAEGGVERRETARLTLPYGTNITTDQYVLQGSKRWNVAHVNGVETLGAQTIVLLTFREVATGEQS